MWSNDLTNRSIELYLRGVVKPHISLEPGGYLSLLGVRGEVPTEHLEIVNNHNGPLKITGVDNDLPDHVRWHLKEVKAGYVYRLEVEDISKRAEDYTAHLIVRTDNPHKPQLVIVISGRIREN